MHAGQGARRPRVRLSGMWLGVSAIAIGVLNLFGWISITVVVGGVLILFGIITLVRK